MEAGTLRNICILETILREVVMRRPYAESRPNSRLGKADDTVEETGKSTRCAAGVRDPASKERFSEITSGRSGGQQGLVDNLHRLIQRGITEVEESLLRLTHESIRARKEEQCPLRRWKARLPNGGHTRIWAKGLWALGGLTVSTVVGHSTGHTPMPRGGSRLWSNQGRVGRMCTST